MPNISKRVREIKNLLKSGNVDEFIELLNVTNSTDLISICKEQKLLLIANNAKVFDAYRQYIKRALYEDDSVQYEYNYIAFLEHYIEATSSLREQIKNELAIFSNRSLREFLFIITLFANKLAVRIVEVFHKNLSKYSNASASPQEQAEYSEWAYHNLNARTNDLFFAVTNLINLFASWQLASVSAEFTGVEKPEEFEFIEKAIYLAGELNSFQYAFDRVSYGELSVKKIDQIKGKFSCQFEIVDVRLETAREIGIQRNISGRMMGRGKNRWSKETLEKFAYLALKDAWNHYNNLNKVIINSRVEFRKAKKELSEHLQELDAEDELLIGLRDPEVLDLYLKGCVLLSYSVAAANLKPKLSNQLYQLTNPKIPVNKVQGFLKKHTIYKASSNNIEKFFTNLPTQQHLDILKRPFIKTQKGEVFAFESFSNHDWTSWVKSNLISGGGTLAQKIGKYWEEYISSTLRLYGWNVLKTGMEIKSNGRNITDIDILVKKDNLLLIMQMKIYYGTGVNTYEQWKFKESLIEGVMQANKAFEVISGDISILKRLETVTFDLKEIEVILPLVITNCHLFNGWKYNDVSIMSTGSLMQILNGLVVKFQTPSGKIIHEKQYSKTNPISVRDILDSIETPLDWVLTEASFDIEYLEQQMGESIFYYPKLVRKTKLNFAEMFSGE